MIKEFECKGGSRKRDLIMVQGSMTHDSTLLPNIWCLDHLHKLHFTLRPQKNRPTISFKSHE